MHGAVYGKGIYLSPHSSVSFGYSGMGHGIFKQSKKLAGQEDAKTRHVRVSQLTVDLHVVLQGCDSSVLKRNSIFVFLKK